MRNVSSMSVSSMSVSSMSDKLVITHTNITHYKTIALLLREVTLGKYTFTYQENNSPTQKVSNTLNTPYFNINDSNIISFDSDVKIEGIYYNVISYVVSGVCYNTYSQFYDRKKPYAQCEFSINGKQSIDFKEKEVYNYHIVPFTFNITEYNCINNEVTTIKDADIIIEPKTIL